MSEGFDYEAHRRMQQKGSNIDRSLLVTFEYAPKRMKDGTYINVEMIRIWLGKNDEVVREVTPEDRVRFEDRYQAFRKGETVPEAGTAIALCPLATPADVSACKAERIFTLEQLAETPDERLRKAKLVNLKYKVRDYLEARARTGYVGELRDQIDAIKAENAMLKERLEALETPEEVEKKKRGRPRKVEIEEAAEA